MKIGPNDNCVPIGTFWDDEGSPNRGDNLCILYKDKGVWSTRTAVINRIFAGTAEAIGTGKYSIYCDDYEKVLNYVEGNSEEQLKDLSDDNSITIDKACVLAVSTGYNEKIIKGDIPGPNDQVVMIGIPVDKPMSDNLFLGLSFASPSNVGNGWFKKNDLYFNENFRLLIITEKYGNKLEGVISPSNPILTFLDFLRNPLQAFTDFFSGNTDVERVVEESLKFDRSYLGESNGLIIYSVYDSGTMLSKIINPSSELREHLEGMCGTFLGASLSCQQEGDVVYVTADLEDELYGEKIWEVFSSRLRLIGSGEGSGTLA